MELDDPIYQRLQAFIEEQRRLESGERNPDGTSPADALIAAAPRSNPIVAGARVVRSWTRSLPTPAGIPLGTLSGIGALLFVSILLLLALQPVREDGTTRLQLLFLAMTGRASLSGSSSAGTVPPMPALTEPTVGSMSLVARGRRSAL